MTKHTPATPPFFQAVFDPHTGKGAIVGGLAGPTNKPEEGEYVISDCIVWEHKDNLRFLAHAANAYPRLVEALRKTMRAGLDPNTPDGQAAALLAELGE